MRKYFFENIFEAVLYLIFISLIPLISVFAQFIIGDKTMYVSYFVAGFAMTYDYFVLFGKSICKRLWWEALIATICLIFTSCIGVTMLTYIWPNANKIAYTYRDLCFVGILAIVF